MLTVRDQQVQSMANASPNTPMSVPCVKDWIEIRLYHRKTKKPMAGEAYRVRLPDSSLMEGSLDKEGKVRFDGIPSGQCQVCFPNIDGREWRRL